MFTAKDVMTLREKTGIGMMECKKALTETDGNIEKAIEFLRERGMAAAAKKSSRIAAEGIVESYIHMGGKIGVLLEVNCETDFVAKSDDFKALVHDIAIHIAAAKPECVTVEEVDTEKLEKEKEIFRAQALNEGKPEKIVENMVAGKVKKYYKEVVLMEQEFVKDSSKNIRDIINEAVIKIGEKITIRRFVRYEMGEGLEKRNDNFADEVASQLKSKE